MTKRERYLERVLILRTMLQYGGANATMQAADIADIASTECDHDALEDLPPISRRGIGQKLRGMVGDGMVRSSYCGPGLPREWTVTEHGRRVATASEWAHD